MPSTVHSVPGRPPAWQRRLQRHRRVVLAVLAALLVGSVTTALRPAGPALGEVVVAAHDLAPGTAIGDTDLTTAQWPEAAVPADAPTDPTALVGRTVVVPLLAGDAVLARHLLTSDLLAGYGPDTVATPLTLGDSAATAVLRAGDVVDVISALPGDVGGAASASVVASRVRVLLALSPGASGGGLLSGPASTGGTAVVLATTTAQALAIARAAVGSRLSVALRSR